MATLLNGKIRGKNLSVRLTMDQYGQILEFCETKGISLGEFARRAIFDVPPESTEVQIARIETAAASLQERINRIQPLLAEPKRRPRHPQT